MFFLFLLLFCILIIIFIILIIIFIIRIIILLYLLLFQELLFGRYFYLCNFILIFWFLFIKKFLFIHYINKSIRLIKILHHSGHSKDLYSRFFSGRLIFLVIHLMHLIRLLLYIYLFFFIIRNFYNNLSFQIFFSSPYIK